jgi:GT2 family glycosyltransferase
VGVAKSRGEILVFVDDDAVLGHKDVLKNLLRPFDEWTDSGRLGVTGASKLLPPDAPWFQRRVAWEIPRIEHPVVHEDLETNPSTEGYGFSEITTTCCAMPRRVFDEVGGFDENLTRGVDTEFFYRVRRLGYRFLLVRDTWAYHPAPATLRDLCRKYFNYGLGHAQEVRKDPERGIGLVFRSRLHAAGYLALRTLILGPNVFIPYSRAYRKWELSFKPLKALASYVNAFGYVRGYYRA